MKVDKLTEFEKLHGIKPKMYPYAWINRYVNAMRRFARWLMKD